MTPFSHPSRQVRDFYRKERVRKDRPMDNTTSTEKHLHRAARIIKPIAIIVGGLATIIGALCAINYAIEKRNEPPSLGQQALEFAVAKRVCTVRAESSTHFVDILHGGCGKKGEKAMWRSCYRIIYGDLEHFSRYKPCLIYPDLRKGLAFGK